MDMFEFKCGLDKLMKELQFRNHTGFFSDLSFYIKNNEIDNFKKILKQNHEYLCGKIIEYKHFYDFLKKIKDRRYLSIFIANTIHSYMSLHKSEYVYELFDDGLYDISEYCLMKNTYFIQSDIVLALFLGSEKAIQMIIDSHTADDELEKLIHLRFSRDNPLFDAINHIKTPNDAVIRFFEHFKRYDYPDDVMKLSVRQKDKKMIRIALMLGADINKCSFFNSPVKLAISLKDEDFCLFLLYDHEKLKKEPLKDLRPFLQYSITGDLVNVTEFLVMKINNVENICNLGPGCPLLYFIRKQNNEFCELLMSKITNPIFNDDELMDCVIRANNFYLFMRLINNNMGVDVRRYHLPAKKRPLYIAVSNNSLEIIEYLLLQGVRVNHAVAKYIREESNNDELTFVLKSDWNGRMSTACLVTNELLGWKLPHSLGEFLLFHLCERTF